MLHMRTSERRTLKPLGTIAVFLGAISLCLILPYSAHASDKYDGSKPLLCVPTAVAECHPDGSCRPGTAESENLPDFFRIDIKDKIIRAEGHHRTSRIRQVTRADGLLSLYGTGVGRSWILIIREKTGKMSASITGDGLSFVIFGVCPAP